VFLPSAIIQFELFESSLWFCVFVFIGILVKSNIDAQKELVQLGLKTAENFKMIGLGQMSAGMAHEINNPLAIISGRAQFAVRKLKLNKDVDTISGDLETILKNTNRITKIIRSLGAFSQSTEAEPMIPVSINKIVNATVETCQAKMRSYAIELRWRSNQDFYVRGHFDQLCQVIMALLQNSMDAVVQQSNAWISIEAKEVQGRVHLVIQDSGAGIPAAIADKIMDPFFTTKEVGKGTGLGLSIVRGIVEAHAGEIYLDRNQKNTTFIIELAKVKPISIPVKEVA
jgi:C4-dicarboxylate-specific signal transduction histidine kinase